MSTQVICTSIAYIGPLSILTQHESGPGTTPDSVKHCTDTLRRLLSPYYAILNVNSSTLLTEPWPAYTALLVFPGGADLHYCREFNGKGNQAITKYVRQGGRYLGFCAGAYYGSGRVEFEVGNREMEVSGARELKFFPGTARGAVFKGFEYGTHENAVAANVDINTTFLQNTNMDPPLSFPAYSNGGCLFVDAEKYKRNGTEVLARYTDQLAVKGSDENSEESLDAIKPAAVIYTKFGNGSVVLSGIHPEFSPDLLQRYSSNNKYMETLNRLIEAQTSRLNFLKSVLTKMGLKVDPSATPIPGLSRLSLTALDRSVLPPLIETLKNEIGIEGTNKLKGFNDTFRIWDASQKQLHKEDSVSEVQNDDERFNPDLDKVIKEIDVYYNDYPDNKISSNFDHNLYYTSLQKFINLEGGDALYKEKIGSILLHGDVVTSTSTMLYKNFNMLRILPIGFAAVGAVQVSGRGRGNNVWVNPPGVLATSTVHRMPLHDRNNLPSPLVFVQYIVSLAMVEAIRSFDSGFEDFPVRLKWPNDIYCENPDYIKDSDKENNVEFYKVGGLLVNSNILDGEYVFVAGLGVNVSNYAPSISLNTIVNKLNDGIRKTKNLPPLRHFTIEELLAKYYVIFGSMFTKFRLMGFSVFEELYYQRWLHSNKIVTLEQHNNVKAKIIGISKDYGMLIVEEVDRNNKLVGKTYELQPDGNSFDMMKGLLKKKS